MRAILTYHSVDPSGSVISTDPATFRKHVEWLAASRVETTNVEDALGRADPDDAVAITFDDGLANFATDAWPVMRDHGISATLFVVTGYVGRTNDWDLAKEIPTLPLLSWDGLARLVEEGVVLAAHSVSHPHLTQLRGQQLAHELATAAEIITERTGYSPPGFAYPYGSYDDRVVEAARLTYAWACTTDMAVLGNATDHFRVPRLDTYYYQRGGAFRGWGTVPFRLRVRLRAAARAVRAVAISNDARVGAHQER